MVTEAVKGVPPLQQIWKVASWSAFATGKSGSSAREKVASQGSGNGVLLPGKQWVQGLERGLRGQERVNFSLPSW